MCGPAFSRLRFLFQSRVNPKPTQKNGDCFAAKCSLANEHMSTKLKFRSNSIQPASALMKQINASDVLQTMHCARTCYSHNTTAQEFVPQAALTNSFCQEVLLSTKLRKGSAAAQRRPVLLPSSQPRAAESKCAFQRAWADAGSLCDLLPKSEKTRTRLQPLQAVSTEIICPLAVSLPRARLRVPLCACGPRLQ